MNSPLLQTKLWQNFQHDLENNPKTPEYHSETTFFEENNDFTYLAIKKSTPAGPYLYLPYGPYAHTKNGPKKALEALQKLAISENAIFIRIEPQDAEIAPYRLASGKYKLKKSHDLNPADTWILDITPSEEELRHGFSQGTRTQVNQFSKKGITVTASKNPDDVKYLVDLQKKLAKTKKIGTFSADYFKTELKQPFTTLYLAHYTDPADKKDKIIAASLFFDDETTRYYIQSATDANYRKLPATVAILATAIFDAKQKGLKNLDFWGIAPENPKTGEISQNHPWAGFTKFKKSFGGTPKHYAGTYDLILSPAKYHFYQILRAINKFKRKIFNR